MTASTDQPTKRRCGRPRGIVSPAKLAALAEAPTVCAACGCSMRPRVHPVAGGGLRTTMTCSAPCRTTMQRRRAGRRPCPICGEHWLHDRGAHGKRTFCSRTCFHIARSQRKAEVAAALR